VNLKKEGGRGKDKERRKEVGEGRAGNSTMKKCKCIYFVFQIVEQRHIVEVIHNP
jgi:hypothetical protein